MWLSVIAYEKDRGERKLNIYLEIILNNFLVYLWSGAVQQTSVFANTDN